MREYLNKRIKLGLLLIFDIQYFVLSAEYSVPETLYFCFIFKNHFILLRTIDFIKKNG